MTDKLTRAQAQQRNWKIRRLRSIESALPSEMPWDRRNTILNLVDQQLRDMGALAREEHRRKLETLVKLDYDRVHDTRKRAAVKQYFARKKAS